MGCWLLFAISGSVNLFPCLAFPQFLIFFDIRLFDKLLSIPASPGFKACWTLFDRSPLGNTIPADPGTRSTTQAYIRASALPWWIKSATWLGTVGRTREWGVSLPKEETGHSRRDRAQKGEGRKHTTKLLGGERYPADIATVVILYVNCASRSQGIEAVNA